MGLKEYRFTKDWPYHVSCGGVVYRTSGGKLQVLVLVRNDRYYAIPKGTLHYGETLEHCALREIEEESGHKGKITGYLGATLNEWVDERSNMNISKVTHYFAVEWTLDTGVHDDEYNHSEWVSIQEAKSNLKQPVGVEIVERFSRFLDTYPDRV